MVDVRSSPASTQSKQSRRFSSSGKGFSLSQFLDSAHVGRVISVPGGGTGRVVTRCSKPQILGTRGYSGNNLSL